MSNNDDSVIAKKQQLLEKWLTGLRILQKGNFLASTHYGKCGKMFGIPVVIMTSIVSSTIFATLGNNPNQNIQIAAGLVSIGATVLSSLQTFLGYADRASSHKEAAVGYGELRTEVQVLLASSLPEIDDLDARIDSIRTRWSALDKASPTLPAWIIKNVTKSGDPGNDPHKARM
ncbi:MAG: SLATT domain-containing protein [Chlorobiaceae bacterium]|nr:SLATT domain-containing protein [Chlorobiaceae bacterium]